MSERFSIEKAPSDPPQHTFDLYETKDKIGGSVVIRIHWPLTEGVNAAIGPFTRGAHIDHVDVRNSDGVVLETITINKHVAMGETLILK